MALSAAGVGASTASAQGAGPGSSPRAALQDIRVRPISHATAKAVLMARHYLYSMPGGTMLALGVFVGERLVGAVTLGAGPANAYRPVEGATRADCLTVTRLSLSDELPPNSESRVLGVVLRTLKKETTVRFVVAYSDPAQGHVGTIYQATNWLYTGLSQATPLYSVNGDAPAHSRSVSQAYGTRRRAHFEGMGMEIRCVPRAAKHRYVYFLDTTWRSRLRVPVLPYPKREAADGRP